MQNVSQGARLIFDIGLHKGEDTDFYLKKGFEVVAVEADPELVSECRSRFAQEIAAGRIHIVSGAIAKEPGKISFYKSEHSVWGTTSHEWGKRNEKLGVRSRLIEVETVNLAAMFKTYGTPYYLKVDIEGADHLVLEALRDAPDLPLFISIESDKVSFKRLRRELQLLKELGYREFKIVQQQNIPGSVLRTTSLDGQPLTYTFEEHSSGSFGNDLSGRWLTYRQAMLRYLRIFLLYRLFGDDGLLLNIKGGGRLLTMLTNLTKKPIPGWFDTHAKREFSPSTSSKTSLGQTSSAACVHVSTLTAPGKRDLESARTSPCRI